jgi:hypothetical protein
MAAARQSTPRKERAVFSVESGALDGGDRAPFLQPTPEPLDAVTVHVDPGGASHGRLVAPGWERRARAAVPDVLAEGVRGVAAVAHDPSRHVGRAAERTWRQRQLVRLTGRQREGDGAARTVGDHGCPSRAMARVPAATDDRPRRSWCRSRRGSGHRAAPDPPAGCRHGRQAPHGGPAPLQIPLSGCPGRGSVRADGAAVEEGHAERDPAPLGASQQALPHPQARPADEGLGGRPP